MKPLREKGGTHMYQKEDVRKFLDEKQISYEWFDHKAVFTIDEMLEIGLEKEEDIAKNLFLRDNKGKRHFLVVIRENKQADLKSLGEKIGAGRLSFASEERLMKYLGLTKGSVTPFGILNDTDCAVEVILTKISAIWMPLAYILMTIRLPFFLLFLIWCRSLRNTVIPLHFFPYNV